MITIAKLWTDGSPDGGAGLKKAVDYFAKRSKDALDYYSAGMRPGVAGDDLNNAEVAERPSRIFGSTLALADLGLTIGQSVEEETLSALALGINPNGRERLINRRGKRVSWQDAVFSLPKSFAVEFAALRAEGREAEAQRFLELMEAAAQASLTTFESQYLNTRRRQGKLLAAENAGIVWALDVHSAARPVEGQTHGDASLHIHARLFNLARRRDGSWSGLYEWQLYNASRTLNQLFEAEARRLVEAAGYKTKEREHGDQRRWTSWELSRVSDELREAFSNRSELIAALLAARVTELETAKGKPLARRELDHERRHISRISRSPKAAKTRSDLSSEWGNTLAQHAYVSAPVAELSPHEVRGDYSQLLKLIEAGPRELTSPRHQKGKEKQPGRSVWHHEDTLSYLAEYAVGARLSPEDVVKAAELIEANSVSFKDPEGTLVFTSQERLAQEKAIADFFVSMAGEARIGVSRNQAERAMAAYQQRTGRLLSHEQREAVYAQFSADGAGLMVGWAGAGKTSTLRPVCDALRASGYNLVGTAIASEATAQLATDAGIPSWNTRDFLTRVEHDALRLPDGTPIQLDHRTVLVVDEAVMEDSDSLFALIKAANKHHIAGIRLAGDPAQTHPIGSGSIVAWLATHLTPSELTKNYRQNEADAQRSALLREGRGYDYLVSMEKAGRLTIVPDIESGIAEAVSKWGSRLASPEDARDHLLPCNLRARGVDPLNLEARKLYDERGWLDHSRFLQVADREYAVGDRVALRAIHKETVPRTDSAGNILYRRGPAQRDAHGQLLRNSQGAVIRSQGEPRTRTVTTPNRTYGSVTDASGGRLVITTDSLPSAQVQILTFSPEQAKHELDYGYAATTSISQGKTRRSSVPLWTPSRITDIHSAYVDVSRNTEILEIVLTASANDIDEDGTIDRDAVTRRSAGLISRDMSQHTTLDYDEANRGELTRRLAHQQAIARDAWSASAPMTEKQREALLCLNVEADPSWTWLRASVELDLFRVGIPGLLAENSLVSHGIDPLLARKRVTDELNAAGLDLVAAMHGASVQQRDLAEHEVEQWLEKQRAIGALPTEDEIAEKRMRTLARIARSSVRYAQEQGQDTDAHPRRVEPVVVQLQGPIRTMTMDHTL